MVRSPAPVLRTGALVLVLLAAAVFTGARLVDTRADLASWKGKVAELETDSDGLVLTAPFRRADTREFLPFVRDLVPEDQPVLTVQGPLDGDRGKDGPRNEPSDCGLSNGTYGAFIWVAYALLPRGMTCDRSAQWWVFMGTPPAGYPPGSVVHSFAPDLAVVDVRANAGKTVPVR